VSKGCDSHTDASSTEDITAVVICKKYTARREEKGEEVKSDLIARV